MRLEQITHLLSVRYRYVALVVTVFAGTRAWGQFFDMGSLPPHTSSNATAISADGRVAVGFAGAYESSPPRVTYSWTLDDGVMFHTPAGVISMQTFGISPEGRFDAGGFASSLVPAGGYRRELATGQFIRLQDVSGFPVSYGLGVSNAGAVTVGRSWRGSGNGDGTANASVAVRWNANGTPTSLGYSQSNGTYSDATAVTPDGVTIIGNSRAGLFGTMRSFRWTAQTGMMLLAMPTVSVPNTLAYAISADGRFVAGAANGADPQHPGYTSAVRWNQQSQWELIPPVSPYAVGDGKGISGIGSIVVGRFSSGGGSDLDGAFIWREGQGSMLLANYLAQSGVNLPANFHIYDCVSVSSDGSVFAGTFYDSVTRTYRGYVAVVARCVGDFNDDGGIDRSDVAAFFASWESGEAQADVNQDGGVDGTDVEFFFSKWQASSC